MPRVRYAAWTATLATALLLVLGNGACGNSNSGEERPSNSRADASTAEPESPSRKAAAPARRTEQPLPAFAGTTLAGQRVKGADFLGQRLLLFFFNPEVPSANSAASALVDLQSQRVEQNFEILGISMASTRENAKAFASRHGIEFSVIDDSSGSILRRFGLRTPMTLLGVDGDGYVIFGVGDPGAAGRILHGCTQPGDRAAARRFRGYLDG